MQKLLRNLFKLYILFIVAGFSIFGLSSVVSQESANWQMNEVELDAASIDLFASDSTLKLPLSDPSNVKTEVEYVPESNEYKVTKKVGDIVIGQEYVSFKEYNDREMDKLLNSYWKERIKSSNIDDNKSSNNLLDKIMPNMGAGVSGALETVLGMPSIELTPTGSAELIFSVIHNKRLDPSWEPRQQRTTNFNFEQKIQLGVNAKIGDKINFDLAYNTEAIFNFENKFKLKYEGKEDDILQLMEFGDIQFPLSTSLIQGSQNLFGAHAQMKFGKLTLNALVAEQKSESKNMQIQNGVQAEEFEVKISDYEENRHYLLAQYFHDHYDETFVNFPIMSTEINIVKLEVWRTNIGSAVNENRNIVAFADLGERYPYKKTIEDGNGSELPDNTKSNKLFRNGNIEKGQIRNSNMVNSYLQGKGYTSGVDYEKVENARKLNTNEYTFNPKLGFISLNQPLTADQVLAVAFQYQIVGDPTVYQVGEFSDDGISDPNTLIVKLLKGTTVNTKLPIWKLMMKNVYFINSQQISSDKFFLNVMYEGNEGGVPTGYFNEGPLKGEPLIQILGLDQLDKQQNRYPDGVFDFVDGAATSGGLIESSTGRVYFPMIEPFGNGLRKKLNDDYYASLYCYDSLYTMTKMLAQQYPEQNKFYLSGSYTSALGNEISIGFNVPQGSVKVLAGGITLMENVDYIVDYMMGKVKIINQGILNSGTPITVTSESNSLFNMTTKRMLGLSANYEFQPNINLGATVLNLHESTQLTKNDYGYEPISNTIWGMNFSYQNEVPLITKLVDALPGISTKAPSTFTFNTEFAHFIPGISKTMTSEKGTTYIDAFESAKSSIDLRTVGSWHMASTPQDYASPRAMFPETQYSYNSIEGLRYGFNRAKLAWYRIGDVFYRSQVPNITKDDISQPYTRRIYEQEVYPSKEIASGERLTISELNLAFYPSEKGPYNYDALGVPGISAGVNPDGTLADPASRWGGVMRKIENPDFESSNIEHIEFWLMDPFIENENHSGGQLVFNLGEISEDILRDGYKSAENGLPTPNNSNETIETIWGRVPKTQPLVYAFDNDPEARKYQDIGYDGLNSEDEASFFADYLASLQSILSPEAYTQAASDPSNDDFRFYRSSEWDKSDAKVLERYKYFNNAEGNSPAAEDNNEEYSVSGTSLPNIEDINKDNTLSENENYYQYIINLKPDEMEIGKNFITNIHEAENIALANDTKTSCKWYQFKVPIKSPTDKVGNIENFQSIRFMRMFLKGFEEKVILRFASLELVQGTWRQYTDQLFAPGDYTGGNNANTNFTVAVVNLEEDGTRTPVPYVLPPGVVRERFYSTSSYTQQNEQSLSMTVEDLEDGDARAIYKNSEYDMRYYKYLKMYVHAEKIKEFDNPQTGDLSLFIRIGNDFTENYYEYELPLSYTPWNVSTNDVNLIWPNDNEVEINLEQLVEIKTSRNERIRAGSTDYSYSQQYSEMVDGKRVTVMGTPNLGKVKVVMIGVRNPRKASAGDGDDMEAKSAMIWINELRLTDFNNKGGWAANALARTNLADLGSVSLYGAYSSSGFGSIDQQIADLDANNTTNFDFATDLELGKFLPEDWGINLPTHFDYSYTLENPEYNPLDPDVNLKDDLKTYTSEADKDSIRRMVQNVTKRTNINFINVRKLRTGKSAMKPRFYQIENFDFSYSYSQVENHNEDIEFDRTIQHKGGFNYNFSTNAKPYKPFKGIKDKNLAILSDFGLNYKIKMISFRTEMIRDYNESKLRNKGADLIIMPVTYSKQFNWTRYYGLQFDPTTNFRIQYDANVNAQIDEPYGKVDKSARSMMWKNMKDGGRTNDFRQNLSFMWDVPINKLPYADWIKVNAGYKASYTYLGPTLALQDLGGSIENQGLLDLNGTFTLTSLYNKVPILAKANKKKSPARPNAKKPTPKPSAPKDPQQIKDSIEQARKERIQKIFVEAGNVGLRLLTSVKTVSIKYSETNGTLVSGYMLEPRIMGLTPNVGWNPGFGFIMGLPSNNLMENLIKSDRELSYDTRNSKDGVKTVLSHDKYMNDPYQERKIESLIGSIVVEPIRDLKIDLSFRKERTDNYQAYYKFDSVSKMAFHDPLSPAKGGAFSITTWLLRTAFKDPEETFNKFMDNRIVIANRLYQDNKGRIDTTDWSQYPVDSLSDRGFPNGYSASSQQVLLPAMIAAYMGKDADDVSYSPFLKMPLPNWNLRYTGLSNIEFLKKWFTNISLSHGYTSTYTIASYTTSVLIKDFDDYGYGSENQINDNSGNFVPKEVIDQVNMSEQFSPLIRIDFAMKNSFVGNFEIRKSRTLGFSFSNTQLTETTSRGVVAGVGYNFKDIEFDVRAGGSTRRLKSDIITKLDLSWTKNQTMLRRLNQNVNQISSGSDVFSMTLSGEYALTKKLTAKLFFTLTRNTPAISSSIPTSTTEGGISIRFTL